MVASAIDTYLASRGRSLSWLAAQSGMPYSTLRGKHSGRSDFTVTDLAEIAAALGISPGALVPPLHPMP